MWFVWKCECEKCRSVISTKLLCNFIEITLRHRCSPLNLLHIFRTPFPRNTSEWLLLVIFYCFRETRYFIWKIVNFDEFQLPYSSIVFAKTSHRFPSYQCLQNEVWNFFILFRSWVICKNKKNLVSKHSIFTLLLIT